MFPFVMASLLPVNRPDYTPPATARRAAAISAGAASLPGNSRSARLYQPRALSRSPSRMCTMPWIHAARVDFSFWTISCAFFQSPAARSSTACPRDSLMSCSLSARLGGRGPGPATACSAHYRLIVALEARRRRATEDVLAPRRRREQRRFRERAADELDAQRHTRVRQAARHRDRRQPRDRPRELKARVARRHPLGRGGRRGRRQQHVVALEQRAHLTPELAPDPEGTHVEIARDHHAHLDRAPDPRPIEVGLQREALGV